MFRTLRWQALLAFVLFLARDGWSQANGLYADFTTSMGSFTCKLEYAIAPKACANFIGLATGQRAWLDLPSGRAKTNAFYNGIIFHRVVPGFVIQAGSPNQQGTDGPGYVFPDEISPALRFTNSFVLAMANSGTNSNGSQFFITVASAPFLNDGYTAFGELAGGTNVVMAISQVATNGNQKPLTNVVIQSVGIRRVGTVALAFNINLQGLPIVTNLLLKLTNSPSEVGLTFSNRLYADNRLYSSTNLINWTPEMLGVETAAVPITNSVVRSKDSPRKFYSLTQVQYPSSTFAPKNLFAHSIALTFTVGGSGTLNVSYDNLSGGTFTFGTSSGPLSYYSWTQDIYRGYLFLVPSGFPPLDITPQALINPPGKLQFNSTTNGTWTGTAYPDYPYPDGAFGVGGTFTFN